MKLTLLLLMLCMAGCHGVMVCYYGSWAVYRTGNGKYDVEQIDPNLCTHIIFAFAGLSTGNEIYALDAYNELEINYGKGAFKRFTNLKLQNTNLKTILAIGGWNEGSTKYSAMASTNATRDTFVASIRPFLNAYGFDGLDMDWEYPADRGGVASDKANFVLLLQELKADLAIDGLLLTMAMPAGKSRLEEGYDLPAISAAVDYMHIMAYDLHGAWEDFVHHHTITYPYRPRENITNSNEEFLNVDWVVSYLIDQGCAREKLALGTATYGRCYSLTDPTQYMIGDASSGAGLGGQYSREAGFMGFNEICEGEILTNANIIDDPELDGRGDEPYAFYQQRSNLWCAYESPASVANKGLLAKGYGLAGMMSWSLETDDFLNFCGFGKNPIIISAYTAYNGGSIPTTPKPETTTKDPNATTQPTEAPTTADPSEHCTQEGLNAYAPDCTVFYNCTEDANGDLVGEPTPCPAGTLFDPKTLVCDHASIVCSVEGQCPNNC